MKKSATEKKAVEKKVQEKKGTTKVNGTVKKDSTVEKDKFGFRVGTSSSEAVSQLAAGKTKKEVRRAFMMLSFTKLIGFLEGRGFQVVEDAIKGGRKV